MLVKYFSCMINIKSLCIVLICMHATYGFKIRHTVDRLTISPNHFSKKAPFTPVCTASILTHHQDDSLSSKSNSKIYIIPTLPRTQAGSFSVHGHGISIKLHCNIVECRIKSYKIFFFVFLKKKYVSIHAHVWNECMHLVVMRALRNGKVDECVRGTNDEVGERIYGCE